MILLVAALSLIACIALAPSADAQPVVIRQPVVTAPTTAIDSLLADYVVCAAEVVSLESEIAQLRAAEAARRTQAEAAETRLDAAMVRLDSSLAREAACSDQLVEATLDADRQRARGDGWRRAAFTAGGVSLVLAVVLGLTL